MNGKKKKMKKICEEKYKYSTICEIVMNVPILVAPRRRPPFGIQSILEEGRNFVTDQK